MQVRSRDEGLREKHQLLRNLMQHQEVIWGFQRLERLTTDMIAMSRTDDECLEHVRELKTIRAFLRIGASAGTQFEDLHEERVATNA